MAVVDKYTDATANAGKSVYDASKTSGGQITQAVAIASIGASDSANSVYRVFKNVPSSVTITKLEACVTQATSVTFGVGIYKPNSGAVVSATCIGYAVALTANRKLDLATNIAAADYQKSLAELAGIDGDVNPVVDIGLKISGTMSGAPTIPVIATFLKN